MDWNITLPEPPADEIRVKCSFCSNTQVPEDRIFRGGDDITICHDCVGTLATATPPVEPSTEFDNPRTCSFCQRQEEFAEAITVGPHTDLYICSECVARFAQAIEQGP